MDFLSFWVAPVLVLVQYWRYWLSFECRYEMNSETWIFGMVAILCFLSSRECGYKDNFFGNLSMCSSSPWWDIFEHNLFFSSHICHLLFQSQFHLQLLLSSLKMLFSDQDYQLPYGERRV